MATTATESTAIRTAELSCHHDEASSLAMSFWFAAGLLCTAMTRSVALLAHIIRPRESWIFARTPVQESRDWLARQKAVGRLGASAVTEGTLGRDPAAAVRVCRFLVVSRCHTWAEREPEYKVRQYGEWFLIMWAEPE